MTVPSSTQQAGPFIGNGVTTSFPFTFKCFDRSHLEWITVTNGVETVQVLDSTYSVTLNGDQDANPGGTVTYPLTGSPMAAGTSATLVGKVPMGQTTDLPDGGAFRAAIVEQALDILALQNLQQQDQIDRALRLPVTAPAGSNGELPPPSADKLIGWGPDGRTLVNRDVVEVVTTAAYSSWRTDRFSGNGSQTVFVLAADPGNQNNCDVTISGVTQVAGVNYTTNGILLTFTVAPPAGTNNIAVRYGQALPQGVADASSVLFNVAASYPVGSSGYATKELMLYGSMPSIFQVLTESQKADVLAYGFTLDLTSTLQTALTLSRTWYFPAGGYRISDELQVTSGMQLQGASSVNAYYGAQAPGHKPTKIWQTTVGKAVFFVGGGVSDATVKDFEITARQNPVAYTGHTANTFGIRMMGANFVPAGSGGTAIQQAGRSSYRLRFERIQGHHFERFISCTDYYWDTTGSAPPNGAADWQCDSVVIDQCTSFGCLHGVYLQSINADAFNLRNVIGNVWTNGTGVNLKRSGYFAAHSCYWTPAETAAGVSATNTTGLLLDGFWDTVTMTSCVASDFITWFFDRSAEPNYDNTEYALVLVGCASEAQSRVQRRTKVISLGSRYTDDILCTGDDIEVHSIGDGFNPTTKRWVMSGLRPNLFVYGGSTQTSGSTSCPNATATTAFSLPVSAGTYNVQAWITGNTPFIAEATLICEGSQFTRIRGTNTGVSITVSGTNNVQLTQTFGSTQPVQWRWQRVA